jgi:tetratricopeptide (TPR) repeat protein
MSQLLKSLRIFSCLFLLLLLNPSLGSCQTTLREMYEAAVDAYNHGQYDQSIEIYQRIIKDMPQFAPAYIGIGLCLKAKGGDVEEVLYYYKTAAEKDPTNAEALDQLGRLYYSIGQMDKAKAVFEKALKINPHLPMVQQTLGWVCLIGKNSNPGRAVLYFKEVIKSMPNPNAYFGLGIAYFASNQREKALEVITQLRDMGQNDFADRLETSVRENRKVVFSEMENPPPAVPEKGFEKTPDTPRGIKVRLRGRLDQWDTANQKPSQDQTQEQPQDQSQPQTNSN